MTVREYRASGVNVSLPRTVWANGVDLTSPELLWLRSGPRATRIGGAEVVLLEVAASELEIEAKIGC